MNEYIELPDRNPRRMSQEMPPAPPADSPSGEGSELLNRVLGYLYDMIPSGEAVGEFLEGDRPDFTPMSFEDYRAKNLQQPPALADYISQQIEQATRDLPENYTTSRRQAAAQAASRAEAAYPGVVADFERRKAGIAEDYKAYVQEQKDRYNDFYSKTFKERNPLLSKALMLGSFAVPAAFTKYGFDKINKKTGGVLDKLVESRAGTPADEVKAAETLRRRMLTDPLLKTGVVAQSILTPLEMRIAQDTWDYKTLPKGTPAQLEAGDNLTPDKIAKDAGLSLLTGLAGAGLGAKHLKNTSRMGEAKAEYMGYKDPDIYNAELNKINNLRRARSFAAEEDRQMQTALQRSSRDTGPRPDIDQKFQTELDRRVLQGLEPQQGLQQSSSASSSPALPPPSQAPGKPPSGGGRIRQNDNTEQQSDAMRVDSIVRDTNVPQRVHETGFQPPVKASSAPAGFSEYSPAHHAAVKRTARVGEPFSHPFIDHTAAKDRRYAMKTVRDAISEAGLPPVAGTELQRRINGTGRGVRSIRKEGGNPRDLSDPDNVTRMFGGMDQLAVMGPAGGLAAIASQYMDPQQRPPQEINDLLFALAVNDLAGGL